MRTRTRNANNSSGTHTHTYNCGGSDGSVTTVLSSETEAFTDVVTPNFRSRIKRGEVIMNPCSRVRTIVDKTGGGLYSAYRASDQCRSTVSGSGSLTTWYATKYPAGGYLDASMADNISAAKVLALAGMDRTPYSFAEDLLEFRETLGLLAGNSLTKLYSLATSYDLKKKALLEYLLIKGSTPKERAKALSNLYLEFQFGFAPLVRSAHDLIESFSTKDSQPTRRVSHGRAPDQERTLSGTTQSLFVYYRESTFEAQSRATIIYEVSNPFDDWRHKYGLRNKDLLVGLWEVFPLSFMIDRLINIKGAIKAAENLIDPSLKILGACTSRKQKHRQSLSMIQQVAPGAFSVTISPDVDTIITEKFDRVVWKPTVSDIVPGVTPGNLVSSISKCVELLALTVQRLR